MEEWVKVYEEEIVIVQNNELMNEKKQKDSKKYKNWLNEMLEDEGIIYKNEIKYKFTVMDTLTKGGNYILEIYVNKNNEETVKELIKLYNKSPIETCNEDMNTRSEDVFDILENTYASDQIVKNEPEIMANIVMKIFLLIIVFMLIVPQIIGIIMYIV